jgi:hypothetical protein
MLEERIGEKFGSDALQTVLAVTLRRHDDDGNELDKEEKRVDLLIRLANADVRARWVCAAHMVHNGSTILADLKRTVDIDSVWSRFSVGRDGTIRWYRAVYDRLIELGFTAPIAVELRNVTEALEKFGAATPASA